MPEVVVDYAGLRCNQSSTTLATPSNSTSSRAGSCTTTRGHEQTLVVSYPTFGGKRKLNRSHLRSSYQLACQLSNTAPKLRTWGQFYTPDIGYITGQETMETDDATHANVQGANIPYFRSFRVAKLRYYAPSPFWLAVI